MFYFCITFSQVPTKLIISSMLTIASNVGIDYAAIITLFCILVEATHLILQSPLADATIILQQCTHTHCSFGY